MVWTQQDKQLGLPAKPEHCRLQTRQWVFLYCFCLQIFTEIIFSSVQFSRSVVSDSLRPRGSQHARPPCPSPTPGVHSDSRRSSQGCQPASSSCVIPFSSFPQSLPASESFPICQTLLVAKVLEIILDHSYLLELIFTDNFLTLRHLSWERWNSSTQSNLQGF